MAPLIFYNQRLFSIINGANFSTTDHIWLSFTTVGDGFILGIILGALIVVNPRIPAMGIILMILGAILVQSLKHLVPTIRPFLVIPGAHIVGPLLKYGSFPSGHTADAFSAAFTLISFTDSKPTRIWILLVAVMIALSRIFVGAHFPLDIVGGICCSLVALIIYLLLIRDRLEAVVPNYFDSRNLGLKIALILELIAVVFAGSKYAVRYAESPAISMAVAFSALLFLAFYYFQFSKSR